MRVNELLKINVDRIVSIPYVINDYMWMIDICAPDAESFLINVVPAEQWLPVDDPPNCLVFHINAAELREMIASNEKHAKIKCGGLTIIHNHVDGVYREDAIVFLIRQPTHPDMVMQVAKAWFK